MTFEEIRELAMNMIDETDVDEQVDIIVNNAINKAYADLCKKDIRLTRAYIPIINGIASLPNNLIKVEKTKPVLSDGDKKVGNAILTEKKGVIEVLYAYTREPLVELDDEPDLHINLHKTLAYYACYKYFSYRKKPEIARMFFEDFSNDLYSFVNDIENQDGYAEEYVRYIEG